MRLIDVDALIEAVEDLYEYAELDEVLDVIKKAPIVTRERPILGVVKADGSIEFKEIKGERPRGAWEIVNTNEPDYHKSIIKCANCGQKFNYIDLCKIAPVKYFPDFCPNCGADMRQEESEK